MSLGGAGSVSPLRAGRGCVSQPTVILMTAGGCSKSDIAADLGCSAATVDNVLKRYRERGLEGLVRHPPPGLVSRATPAYHAALRKAVQTRRKAWVMGSACGRPCVWRSI